MIGKSKFGLKIMMAISLSCTVVAAVVSIVAIYYNYIGFQQTHESQSQALYGDFDRLIKFEVETSVSMLQQIYDKHKKGEMSLDQAKKTGADLLRSLRYGADGYFWADTVDGVNVVLLGKDAEGKSRIDLADKKGNFLVKDFIAKGRAGGGYSDYYFPKAGGDVPLPKRAYTLEFKPFGWVIGTGNYTDDIAAILAKDAEVYKSRMMKNIFLLAGVAVLSIIFSLVFAFRFFKKVMFQLGGDPDYIANIATKIAQGDLTAKIEFEGARPTGVLAAMDIMTTKLKGIVASLKSAAESISTGSNSLSSNSEEITRNMTEQSSRSTQIATAAEEMSQTVIDIAKNASNIALSATETAAIARNGEKVVDKSVSESQAIASTVNTSVEVISTLGDKSKQIGEIIGVINDIADQTNLLALNAAIEAARAGEQGRGFAVVADEVRKLAERTGKATSEIRGMIMSIQSEVGSAVTAMEQTNSRVQSGLQYSIEAGTQLKTIVKSVDGLQSMVQQIASATEQMSSTSEMISGDIQEVATSANQISSGSGRIAHASAELAHLSGQLKGIVDQFRV
jgi:methyl-accepting chemotaxis protein